MESSWFFASILSLASLSSAACASASLAMRSTSSLLRPEELVIAIFASLPVALSFALTFRMPFASISNVTSICGTPRGAGMMPPSLNLPSVRFCEARGRSPCVMWTSTSLWLSAAVEQQQVLHFSAQDTSLDRRSNCDDFVGIYALVRFLAKQLLHQLLDLRH